MGELLHIGKWATKKVIHDPVKNTMFLEHMIERGMTVNIEISELSYDERVKVCKEIIRQIEAREEP